MELKQQLEKFKSGQEICRIETDILNRDATRLHTPVSFQQAVSILLSETLPVVKMFETDIWPPFQNLTNM